MKDPEWITELETLRAKATPGTWRASPAYDGADNADVESDRTNDPGYDTGQEEAWPVFQDSEGLIGCGSLADAEYVAALHNSLPQLLALIRSRQEAKAQ
jgi:hypothetical protein